MVDGHACCASTLAFAAQGHVTSLSSRYTHGFAIFFALDLICCSQAVGDQLLLPRMRGLLIPRWHGMEWRRVKSTPTSTMSKSLWLCSSTPENDWPPPFILIVPKIFLRSDPLLAALGAGSGDVDSTLPHCEDLTEQELHPLPSFSLSWCSSSSLPHTVAIIPAIFFRSFLLRFLVWSSSFWLRLWR